ncbi:MAG TPA: gamma-glutamyltransferase [Conexibacter sp.]|jgi:gamma-glutamyltranspeptidase/glutathione hydrolase|nr:gamma-glutamyltransferase [Conexibacter sp.]
MTSARGVVAAGHPLSAEAGAELLRAGGNAVDAALAAMLTSFAAEPLLSGLGAGGYMLVVPGDADAAGGPWSGDDGQATMGKPVVLDFFVEVPGRGADRERRAELVPIDVSFGDAVQLFNVGAASVGTYGMPHGICTAAERFGRVPLAELAAPAAALARAGVPLNAQQSYVVEILGGIVTLTPEVAAIYAPDGRVLREGERVRQPALADAIERLGMEGAWPFYEGEVAAKVAALLAEQGGLLTAEDLAAYETVVRAPVRARYRGREVLTNPPPSAGGTLIALALGLLDREDGPPSLKALVAAMDATQRERGADFLDGLDEPGFAERFLAGRLGSTTHVSVIDGAGGACSVTCSNGEGAGIVVPGTGIHLNNMLGEHDLNPLGFHMFPTGRRLPSMMAPTAVLRDGVPELVVGSAGSNRIRSAILQTIVAALDHGMRAGDAVRAPRIHYEDGVVYAEPGVDVDALEADGHAIARFRALNLFFGGVQAVERDPATGALSGGGDPRRGGAAVVA